MRMRARHRLALWGAAILALAGCEMPAPTPPAPPPAMTRPPAPSTPSAASAALADHYARIERDLLSRGLLRSDGGGPDTPWTDTDLLRNFEAIVFFDEYMPGAGYRPSAGQPGALRKWTAPVRLGVEFGPSVPRDQRAADRASVEGYAARLSRAARHPVSATTRASNFHVLIMSEDDRSHGLARVRQIVPDIDQATLGVFQNMPRSIHCLVVAFSHKGNPHSYDRAIAWIRAEHPPLMRAACIHEELAQGMGLANDSPRARPSIFNDDEEFALLTRHDEELLWLLYHPDLKPGMTPDEARPIIRRLLDARAGGPV
ncbi:DUF2927 domain-containing protein [Roseovarius autotrophicus]|uniref:DUF2927 domain-containing protein n=1 Tax=Roseovarius autotrophicus TaxID=2824121 RepID=UPI001B38F488|nr:DUF2927 domain-containing protein [Roseovarius autotrophicus]